MYCPYCRHPDSRVIDSRTSDDGAIQVAALVEFAQADGVRLLAAVVDTPLSAIQIGSDLIVSWSEAMNAKVPVFRVRSDDADSSENGTRK